MRLDENEIATIKKLAVKHFGNGTKVFLFGSRAHDDKKGGDIDLFITNENRTKLTLATKIDFLTDLKSIIGDQKIDVVLDTNSIRRKNQFYQSVTKKSVEI
jgi:predicted nucleotidyltransferase